MKSNFLLLVSLVLSLNVFSQSCPTLESEVLTVVRQSSGFCTYKIVSGVNNPTSAVKGFNITVYSGSISPANLLFSKCNLVPGGNTTVETPVFTVPCGTDLFVINEGSTAGNNQCLAGNVCNRKVTNGNNQPPVVLPVKLTSFEANGKNGIVSLKWTSESEINFNGYQIEMNDGTGFRTVGSLLAKNNGLTNNYSFEYNSISKQSIQFRLKMIDIDGKFTYSNTALVKADGQGFDFNIYPNPSTSANTNILVSGLSNDGRIQIIDMAGKVLKTLVVNSNNVKVGYLPTGVYMVKVSNSATTEQVTKRMVIVN